MTALVTGTMAAMWTSATDQSRFVHSECAEPLFSSSYKRNNKSSGNKHLRCFPHCCIAHNATGYCGSTLRVATTVDQADLMVFAKFDLEDAPNATDVSCVVNVAIFDEFLRGRRLDVDASAGAVFEINSKRNSWHYGWVSSRFVKSTVQHQMKVYVMAPKDARGYALCVDILKSKSFFIESTRTGTKLQAKLLAQRQTTQATLPSNPEPPTARCLRKRPYLVLEDPAALSSFKPQTSPPAASTLLPLPKHDAQSISTLPSSFLARRPSSPLTLAFTASYSSPSTPVPFAHPYQAAVIPPHPPTYHIPSLPSSAMSSFWISAAAAATTAPRTQALAPIPAGFSPVSTTTNKLVLGNDLFLDSLISGMDEDDDDGWSPPSNASC